ncbi:MAG: IclR family transcriptional regulator [Alphaproteobacteria bacterium]|nr:IclR family transcriptional regulator [Alphaproteobacteria bacterium]
MPPVERHGIPAIDRAMRLLAILEHRPQGASIRDLAGALHLPRTSVYRIVNSLELHQVLRRSGGGDYALGPRLLALASRVQSEGQSFDLAALAQPVLERLVAATGEATKISVLDGDSALVIAAMSGKRDYALAVAVGQRLPLHAGAAGKVLLANLEASARELVLARPLQAHTGQTLSDRRRLAAELGRVRRQGWAQDLGEFLSSVHAFAAPLVDRAGRVVGALSVPFLAGTEAGRVAMLRAAVIDAAARISEAIPRPSRPPRSRTTAASRAPGRAKP